jgi:AmmeMemoRadiSam system protein A
MPHPPIIVPEVGRGREKEAATTLTGLDVLQRRLADRHAAGNAPELLFALSPHLPWTPGSLFINTAPRVCGSLKPFGAPGVVVEAEISPVTQDLVPTLRSAGIPVAQGALEDLTGDHGSLVPLHCLSRVFAKGRLPPLIMANPAGLSPQHALLMGKILAGFAPRLRRALLSSGDLSHRLKPGAPAGYSPDGAVFDSAVVDALKHGNPSPLMDLPPSVRENAGECGLRPVLVLLGLCAAPVEVLSYEGPFGVGYCNALWSPDAARPARGHPYARLARLTVERRLSGAPLPGQAEVRALDPDQDLWKERKACFVSIKGKDGSLRGCIGSILPVQENLAREIVVNAVSASVRDPRFPPMQATELANVDISVDVLSLPETVKEGMELDPKIWGVIVTQGAKRGLLLPDLPGVDSVERQIAIAAQKAGIAKLEGMELQRFTVDRYYEE